MTQHLKRAICDLAAKNQKKMNGIRMEAQLEHLLRLRFAHVRPFYWAGSGDFVLASIRALVLDVRLRGAEVKGRS